MDISGRLVFTLSPILSLVFSAPVDEIRSENLEGERMSGNNWRSLAWAFVMLCLLLSGFLMLIAGTELALSSVVAISSEVFLLGLPWGVLAVLFALRAWVGWRSEDLERRMAAALRPRSTEVLVVFLGYVVGRLLAHYAVRLFDDLLAALEPKESTNRHLGPGLDARRATRDPCLPSRGGRRRYHCRPCSAVRMDRPGRRRLRCRPTGMGLHHRAVVLVSGAGVFDVRARRRGHDGGG